MTVSPHMVLSLICVVLNIVPFCWQVQHGNSGPACLGFWVILTNLVAFINAFMWRNDAIDRAPVWCDISAKIFLGGGPGLLASTVCISRFLARVVNPNGRVITSRDRRNRVIFDCCFSFGVPIAVMATHIIYQPVRYGIQRTWGCQFTLTVSWPSIFLYFIWEPVLALISAGYAVYAIVQLLRHRQSFSRILARSESALTTSRFIRLVLLSATYALFQLPLTITLAVQSLMQQGLTPYSWQAVHEGMNRGIIFFEPLRREVSFHHYAFVIAGLLVFIFFGVSKEVLVMYEGLVKGMVTAAKRLRTCEKGGASTAEAATRVDVSVAVEETSSLAMTEARKGSWDDVEQNPSRVLYSGPFASSLDEESGGKPHIAVTRHEYVL